jgi:hypothetical protein
VLGLPYLLDPATLETKGKDTLNGVLNDSHCLAAHFRYDAATDRLVNFRSVVLNPCVSCACRACGVWCACVWCVRVWCVRVRVCVNLRTSSFQLAMSGKCKLFIYEFARDWKLLSKQVHSFESYYYCRSPFRLLLLLLLLFLFVSNIPCGCCD